MRKILIVVTILLIVVACNKKADGFVLTGNITGELENGTKVFLKKQGENNQPEAIDTALVDQGKFVFKGVAGGPEIHYIFVDKLPGYAAIILENGEIEMTAQKDSLGLAKIVGTPQNDMLAAYMKKAQAMSMKGMAIQKDMQAASIAKDESTMSSLNDEMSDFQTEYKTFELDFIKENPSALISVLLLDKAIARRTIEFSQVEDVYNSLSPEIKETKTGKEIAGQLEAIKAQAEANKSTEIGRQAPDFTAPDVNGKQLALKDMMGKVTLIDFWAAWCKPCRQENPTVVAAYKKYHKKGLNIVGVSLDKNAEDWKKAIQDDGLIWNQVSHVKYFQDPVARLYNVDAIPAAFLLDENGVIVAKNLRGPALERKISELLD